MVSGAVDVTLRYLPIAGLRDFVTESVKLAYGDDSPAIQGNLVAAVQSLSGTGSCRLFAEFQVTMWVGLLTATIADPVRPAWQSCGVIHMTSLLSAELPGI